MSATPSPRHRPGPITVAAAALGALRNRVHIVVTPQQVDAPEQDDAPPAPQARSAPPVDRPTAVQQSGWGLRVAGDYGRERRR